ncbi:hypothetical protein B0J11DRAFT_263219 [Dendryphion nanum]|uniref:Uncharacterized protein n=1 Tax=Dendryphion nanum TaxID=256645 RepID=A0A9P9IR27_9PLEO|nr:hypothetical protein B0J11DRAFT_263219 [Dendryphion nanum]
MHAAIARISSLSRLRYVLLPFFQHRSDAQSAIYLNFLSTHAPFVWSSKMDPFNLGLTIAILPSHVTHGLFPAPRTRLATVVNPSKCQQDQIEAAQRLSTTCLPLGFVPRNIKRTGIFAGHLPQQAYLVSYRQHQRPAAKVAIAINANVGRCVTRVPPSRLAIFVCCRELALDQPCRKIHHKNESITFPTGPLFPVVDYPSLRQVIRAVQVEAWPAPPR